jgi:hypothetical protein
VKFHNPGGTEAEFSTRFKHHQICFNPKHGAGFGDKTGRWGVSNAADLAFSFTRKDCWIFWSTETTWQTQTMKVQVPRVGKEVATFIRDHEATMIIYTWAMRGGHWPAR